ncbi:MAG TPA: energy-coupling factor ABC transporter permease, partial [Dissulfurispiraceae bacterium]|nr:energy-coupling factor ABC transporter permease [Dissulfurispiraceae bacterium]
MGVVGSAAGYAVFRLMRFMNIRLSVAAFSAGLFADWATYTMTALELTLAIRGDTPLISLFTKIVIAFVPTQLPLGILEGFMTAGMVVLLSKKRPDLLVRTGVLKPGEAAA